MLTLLFLACTADLAVDSGAVIDSGAVDPGPASGTLRTLTYNVHGLPSAITGDDTPGRMELIAPLLPAYDLLGLQEDFDADNHAVLTAQCTHPVHAWFDDKVEEDRFYGSGLSVLGPGEATLVHHQHYSACNGITDGASDCLASKGFQLVRLDLGQGEVDVYNTHLEAGSGAEDNAARQVHVDELTAAMATYSADRAIIFLADSNLHGDDPVDQPLIAQLEGVGLRNACHEVDCPEPDRIDVIMVRDGGGVSLTVDSWSVEGQFVDDQGVDLSDHNAIAAELSWAVEGGGS